VPHEVVSLTSASLSKVVGINQVSISFPSLYAYSMTTRGEDSKLPYSSKCRTLKTRRL
jgi:hypothetical protein